MDEYVVEFKSVTFKRENKIIFDGLDLRLPRGKITVIMGPSGTGKTTLLRLIGGQIKSCAGQVLVDGHNVSSLTLKKLYVLRRRMGILFQLGALFTDLSVFENVAFPLRAHTDLPEEVLQKLVLLKLESVGLRGAADMQVDELSGGMARRVALARAIVMDPAIMMYDEPFTGQDPITQAVLVKLVRSLNDALGMTSVLVTHDLQQAMALADHLVIVSQGKVIGEGTPDEIKSHDNPAVYQFIHGEPDGVVPFQYPAGDYREALLS